MAHEITATDNLFTSNSKAAWHGLGTVFDGYPTKQEAYDAAFGWEPVSEPLYRKIPVITPEGDLREEFEKIESDELIVRSDNAAVLGTAPSGRGVVSNMELFDIAEALEAESRGDKPMRLETGGSIRGGERVWLLLRLEEGIKVKNDYQGDTIPYFALQNGHTRDGGAFKGQAVFTRICCHAVGTKVLYKDQWINVEDHPGVMGFKDEDGLKVSLAGLPYSLSEVVTLDHKYWARIPGEKPGWVDARDLTHNHEVGYPVPDNTETDLVPERFKGDEDDFWWMVGLFWGDGHLVNPLKNSGKSSLQVSFSISDPDIEARAVAFMRRHGYTGNGSARPGCHQYTWSNGDFRSVVEGFYHERRGVRKSGKGAHYKHPYAAIESIPLDHLTSLVNGYYDADGNLDKGRGGRIWSSIDVESLLSLRRMLMRLGVPSLLRKGHKEPKNTIQGRAVNVNQPYTLRAPAGPSIISIEDGWVWSPVTLIEWAGTNTFVPLDCAEDDHVYTTHFGRSHNCSNTMKMSDIEAGKRGTEFSFKHTGKIGERIAEAKQALVYWRHGVTQYEEMMEHLYSIRVNDLTKEDFIQMFIPEPITGSLISDRVRNNILSARGEMQTIIDSRTSDGFLSAGTLLSASVEWSQHYKGTRGKSERDRQENRFSRAYLNDSALTKGAYKILKDLVPSI